MRLLIVKFSSIGDCVMAVPVASRVRRGVPGAFIAWAVDPRCADVLDTTRLIDHRFDVPWERWKRERVGPIGQLRHYLQLRKLKFDVGLDLQGHSKTAICLRLSGAKRRLSVRATDGFARALNPIARSRGAVHTVERNLEVLDEVLPCDAPADPIMPALGDPQVAPDVTIAVGAGHPKKVYRRWDEVAVCLQERGRRVAFIGGPGEQAPDVPGTRDFVAKASLLETMSLIAASKVHVAADTGSGHIAAAYGVPVVSVFGATDPAVYRPYGPGVTVLNAGVTMTGVEPEAIVEAVCGF